MKTKVFFFLVLFVFAFQNSSSQNKLDIDSLLTTFERQELDTFKVKTANNIVNYYMYRDPGKAKEFAFTQLQLSNQLDYDSGRCLAQYQIGIVYGNQEQIDSSRYYYNKSLQLAEKLNNGIYKSQVFRGLSILEFSQGNLKKADSINDLDLANTIALKDSMGIALAYDFKGTINQNRGYYSVAFTNVLKGFKLMEQLGDSIRIADSYNHLATLEYNMENYQKAIGYNQKALKIYEDYDDIFYQAQALNDLGVQHLRLAQYPEALSYFDASIIKSKEASIPGVEASSLTNIGAVYFEQNQPQKAIDALEKAIVIAQTTNAQRRVAIAQNQLAKVYNSINQPRNAIEHATAALAYSKEKEILSIQGLSNQHLSDAYALLGDNKNAFAYYKGFKMLNDSIINKEKVQIIEEQRIIFDTEKKEAAIRLQKEKIESLNAKAKNDKLTKTLYTIGLISLVVILGLLYFGFKQRIKKNRIAREKQEAILKQEIAFKKKELASQTLHLVQKSTFITELKDNLVKIKQSPELFKVEFRRLVMLLKRESAEDKDWEVFKSYFSQVHNDFDRVLKSISADISEKEIRLASFIRMNLTTKEIASMLNVLPDSVLTSKYRLKKKLNLTKEQSLNDYLNTL
ncbi:MAG: tetratricopeptide repeat protein [Gilvibacter sp.]